MGRRNRSCPGLRPRGGVWWIDIDNQQYGRICESTGCRTDIAEHRALAEERYRQRLTQALQARILGVRPPRIFREAATKHLEEERGRIRSLDVDAWALEKADRYIGSLQLEQVHDGTLEPLKASMRDRGNKGKSINLVLQVVRKILNKAARKWRDDGTGKTWLETAPLISMVPLDDSRSPYPLSWDEERRLLLPALPSHLQDPAIFTTNVGTREQECAGLRWAWERRVPELDSPDFKVSLFILPTSKNGRERVLVLNRIAQSVVDRQREKHPEFVFTYQGKPLMGLNNTAWQTARASASEKYRDVLGMEAPQGFRTLHWHDLRHTFGRRLRAAGVPSETRADLLGHARKGSDMTTHYSAAELRELVDAVRLIEAPIGSTPTLTVLRAQAA